MKQLQRITLSFLFSLLICSCTDHQQQPDPQTQFSLQQNIVGKYAVQSSTGRTTENNAFVEFTSDSTYILYNITSTLTTGRYKATSETEISLSDFGVMSQIQVVQSALTFKLTTTDKSLTLSTQKVKLVHIDSATKALSRHWTLTNEEDGDDILSEKAGVDKATVIFSESGTYLVQFFLKGELVLFEIQNWDWHSTDANRIVYWPIGGVVNENKDYVIIRELSPNLLKTSELTSGTLENYTFKSFN